MTSQAAVRFNNVSESHKITPQWAQREVVKATGILTGEHRRIHRLLNRIEWEADEVLDEVRDYVVPYPGRRPVLVCTWPARSAKSVR